MRRLLDILFPPRADGLLLRDVTPNDFCGKCAPQLVGATRPATATLFSYADPVARAAIHEAKYHGSEHAFSLLAAALADFLPDYLAEHGAFSNVGRTTSYISIVPVPLGAARRKERGFNQVEEVARRALCSLGEENVINILLDASLLARVRETPSQVSLERAAREKNMRDAFGVAHSPDPARLYIILDDVLTTGATLQACLDALVAAGIPRDHLLPIALAH